MLRPAWKPAQAHVTLQMVTSPPPHTHARYTVEDIVFNALEAKQQAGLPLNSEGGVSNAFFCKHIASMPVIIGNGLRTAPLPKVVTRGSSCPLCLGNSESVWHEW